MSHGLPQDGAFRSAVIWDHSHSARKHAIVKSSLGPHLTEDAEPLCQK